MDQDPSTLTASSRYSLQRLERITDLVFAVSLLLLLLQLDLPNVQQVSPAEINHFLRDQLPSLQIYITTFVLIAFYWQSNLSQMRRYKSCDGLLLWCHLLGLMGVAFLPYVNNLLERFPLVASVQLIYSLTLAHVGVFALLAWLYACRRPEQLLLPLPSLERLVVSLEAAIEPLICLLSISVSLLISPDWWEWSFLLFLPAYGLMLLWQNSLAPEE